MTGRDGPFSVEKDVPRALEAFRIGCKGGLPDACHEAARLVFRDATIKLAAAAPPAPEQAGSAARVGRPAAAVAPATPAVSAATPESAGAGAASGAAASAAAAAGGDAAAPAPAPLPAPISDRSFTEDLNEAIEMLHRGCTRDTTSANGRCCGMLAASWYSTKIPVALVWESLGMPAPAGASPHPAVALGVPPEQIAAAAKGLPQLGTPIELLETACTREHAESCLSLGTAYRLGDPRLGITANIELAEKFDKQGFLWQGMTERVANRSVAKKAAALTEMMQKAAARSGAERTLA